jgi:Cu-Zn family superoxide dismutase
MSVALTAIALAACATGDGAGDGGAGATATLRDASGNERGQASVVEVGDGVRLRIQAAAMTPGTYGAHIHAVGRCEAPDFASAGSHWNPTARQHGKDNPQGMHMGDLPNVTVGSDGRGSLELVVPGARLNSGPYPMLDADGAAVVIHAAPDDYRTDPSGNSGARIACGVLS